MGGFSGSIVNLALMSDLCVVQLCLGHGGRAMEGMRPEEQGETNP